MGEDVQGVCPGFTSLGNHRWNPGDSSVFLAACLISRTYHFLDGQLSQLLLELLPDQQLKLCIRWEVDLERRVTIQEKTRRQMWL